MTATNPRFARLFRVAVRATAVCAVAATMFPATMTADDADPDLQGILPEYIPDGLTEDDFAELGDNWAEWAEQTGLLVSDLYASDDDEVRARRTTLEAVQVRLDTMKTALNDPQYLGIYGPLSDLYGRLSRRIAVATALLDVVEPGERREELRDLAATLVEAIEVYEGEPTSESMGAVRHSFDDLRRLTPDGAAALTRAMRKHYLNYNLRVVVDETLAQDLIRDTRMESGFINEMASKARITGCQWTNTTVNVDFQPCDTSARFDLVLNGSVRSRIQGETHAATVYTTGNHCFTGRKAVVFDGEHFCTWPARVGVGGANNPYAAKTCMSWVPLLGSITENVAMNVAGSEENNQFARNKIYREARSQFDRETANMLNEAELKLESDVSGPLREEGYYPDVKQFSTTDRELLMRARVMESEELGGGEALPFPIYPSHGVLVQIHQSLLNQIGSRLELDGKRFTPDDLEAYLKEKIEKIAGQEVELGDLAGEATDESSDSPKVEEVIFHEADAFRVQIDRGEVVLILSVGLKLEGREEIEPQRITVPLKVSLEGDQILVSRGTVGVRPIGRVNPRDRAQQITRAGVMRAKIQEAFKPQEVDSLLEATLQEDKTIRLRVTDLRARGGWLSVIATDGISDAPATDDGSVATQRYQYVRQPDKARRR